MRPTCEVGGPPAAPRWCNAFCAVTSLASLDEWQALTDQGELVWLQKEKTALLRQNGSTAALTSDSGAKPPLSCCASLSGIGSGGGASCSFRFATDKAPATYVTSRIESVPRPLARLVVVAYTPRRAFARGRRPGPLARHAAEPSGRPLAGAINAARIVERLPGHAPPSAVVSSHAVECADAGRAYLLRIGA